MSRFKSVALILIVVLIIIVCSSSQLLDKNGDVQTVVGYIYIDGDTLYIDEVEIITRDDKERIKELGLIENRDYPSGYCIHNVTKESDTFKLTKDTLYQFRDLELFFVKDAEGSRIYETTDVEEFYKGSSYRNVPLEEQRIPYIIEVHNGKVQKIIEKFEYTI